MTKPVSVQVTQTCMMTKLPIKHYKTHTTAKIHGETIPSMILARFFPVTANLVTENAVEALSRLLVWLL